MAHYEPYLDGLFTYCLSVLCDHDTATAALGDALAVSERQRARGRRVPADKALERSWLYALARWACQRKLAELTGCTRQGPRETASDAAAAQRRRELAALAWPEAAGTTAEQREALELSVRHRLTPQEVAAVIGRERDETRALLASAACEVERTRAALAVVELGHCPVVARLAGDTRVLLSAALRRELVRHVDDCRACRRRAEQATAGGPWPGTAAAPAELPVLDAPRPAVHAAMLRALRARPTRAGAGPRFDRLGFPLAPKDRAARRSRMRSRAMATTVVATVIAAPVLALWAAYRGAPLTGEARDADAVASREDSEDGLDGRRYEEAGSAQDESLGPWPRDGAPGSGLAVDVIGPDGGRWTDARGDSGATREEGAERRKEHRRSRGEESRPPRPGRPAPGPGRLTVDAQPSGDVTAITLTASGGSPVRWSATPSAGWLQLSRTAGVLRPGESVTFTVYVDHGLEPEGRWSARVEVGPSAGMVVIEGGAPSGPTPGPTPSPTPPPSPTPSDPPPAEPSPTPQPTTRTG
ncbi:sigma-70 family RNA polymerase sigma factor [Streptomyces sp. XD-27]|uniref:BACON domain-containing protein n=1 Tax=Streptomyces sp. XD-27 TaxID=3062779 RepID=UPI0026F46C58|nr:sigma-70 family RNA polymerase sigma factor [Streptomyces sp. XD-27]WKX71833.1 sigma-70 family RNA polymerase sigma factor [Streptomyces sp. XD-27]